MWNAISTLDLGRGEVNVWRERVKDESDKTKVSNISTKTPIPVTASKDSPKEKNSKDKKVKEKKVKEKPAGEKSLFEQTIESRKKKNNWFWTIHGSCRVFLDPAFFCAGDSVFLKTEDKIQVQIQNSSTKDNLYWIWTWYLHLNFSLPLSPK